MAAVAAEPAVARARSAGANAAAGTCVDALAFRDGCGRLSTRQACAAVGVDPAEQPALDALLRRRRMLAPGDLLFRSGDVFRGVHLARRGAFKTVEVTADGDERVLGFHLPGELVGFDGLADGRHRCTAVALENADAGELDPARMLDAAATLPSLRQQLARLLAQSPDAARGTVPARAPRAAHARVAAFLDDLAARFCLLGHPSTAFRLPMSREDIARHLGLSLDTLGRALTRLQQDGALFVQGRQLEILDPRALARALADLD